MRHVDLARETIAQSYEEAMPLLLKHYTEIAQHQDIALNVDVEMYRRIEEAGMLRIYTARRFSKLVGYATFIIGSNGHYKDSLQAKQDVFYVDPSHRGIFIGPKLIGYADAMLTVDGIQVVYHHQKLAHPTLGVLLAREGYEHVENIWGKRLDRSA